MAIDEVSTHYYGSSLEGCLCSYHVNFVVVMGISISILRIVSRKWVDCLSLVKTTEICGRCYSWVDEA